MSISSKIGLTFCTIAAFICCPVAAQEVGVASAVRNEVFVKSESDTAPRGAEIGTDIKLKDLVTSGDQSAMQVLLLDETTFTIGPRAEMVIDRFVYDPDAQGGEMTATVAKGAFRFMSGKTAKNPENVRVNTPVASMGIRGTIVEGAVGQDAIERLSGLEDQFQGVPRGPDATLIVLRGPSSTTGSNLTREGAVDITTTSGTVTLTRANSAIFIPAADIPIIGPFPLPEQTVRSFGEQVVSTPTGAPVAPLPDVETPAASVVVEEEPIELNVQDPEEENVVDRPTIDCPIADGIPVTDGGLILGGDPDQTFDDFGSIDFGLDCTE